MPLPVEPEHCAALLKHESSSAGSKAQVLRVIQRNANDIRGVWLSRFYRSGGLKCLLECAGCGCASSVARPLAGLFYQLLVLARKG